MIDLHSHILPGLDDGVRDLAASVALARAAAADGIGTIAATPHVRDDYPTTPESMEAATADVVRAVAEAGIDVRVVTGGELALNRLDLLDDDALARFQLGGDSRHLLVEAPYRGWPLDLHERVQRLRAAGWTPVLAHPERNDEVQDVPERLRPLVRAGVLVQLTAASLDGRLGRGPLAAARTLLDLELAHLLASDAHAPDVRTTGLSAAAAAVGDVALAHWLTTDVPAAILAGGPLPPRPERTRRRRWLRR